MGGFTDTPTLACGCRRGFHLCDIAVKLWATAWATPYDQPDEYQRAYSQYEGHFHPHPFTPEGYNPLCRACQDRGAACR